MELYRVGLGREDLFFVLYYCLQYLQDGKICQSHKNPQLTKNPPHSVNSQRRVPGFQLSFPPLSFFTPLYFRESFQIS